MTRVKVLSLLLSLSFVLCSGNPPVQSAEVVSLGPSTEVEILPPHRECGAGELFVNFEGLDNAGCWQGEGIVPPYYGALAEAFDLGAGMVHCGAFWVTTTYGPPGQPADIYIWDGGITGEPAEVISLLPGHVFENVPFWPELGQNDVTLETAVAGEFTLGYWLWPCEVCGFHIGHDGDCYDGHPWTCVAPGVGYPTGWIHPRHIWGAVESHGVGAYFCADPSAPHSGSWGEIKGLFR